MNPEPQRLLAAEALLAHLRTQLQGTDFWASVELKHDSDKGPPTPAPQVLLTGLDGEDAKYNGFFWGFWSRHRLGANEPNNLFASKSPEPRRIIFRTTDRLAVFDGIPLLAKALDGRHITLEEDDSWTWDRGTPLETGGSMYRTMYLLHLELGANEPFNAKKWLKTAMNNMCGSEDERADYSPFQLDELAGGKFCHAYRRTSSGFRLEFETKALAAKAIAKVWAGCEVTYVPQPRGERDVVIDIAFPDMAKRPKKKLPVAA